jgi:hypothetical protein
MEDRQTLQCNNVYVHDKTYGFWVKQEVGGTCDQSFTILTGIWIASAIFNCMIKRVSQEGMYLGSTGENADRQNAVVGVSLSFAFKQCKCHDNIVDSTGRGGIMISGADKGVNNIFNNTITRCGL